MRRKLLAVIAAVVVATGAAGLASRNDPTDDAAYASRLMQLRDDLRMITMRIESRNGVDSVEEARELMDQLDAAENVRMLDRLLRAKDLPAHLVDRNDDVDVTIEGTDVVRSLSVIEQLNLLPLQGFTVDEKRIEMIVPHVVRPAPPPPRPALPRPSLRTLGVALEVVRVALQLELARPRLYSIHPGQRVLDDEDFLNRARTSGKRNNVLINPELLVAAALWSEPRVVETIDLGDLSDYGFHATTKGDTDAEVNAVRARVFPRSVVVPRKPGVDVSFGFARDADGLRSVEGILSADDPRVVVARTPATEAIDASAIDRAKGLDPGVRLLLAYVLAGDVLKTPEACANRRRAVASLLVGLEATFGHFATEIDGLAGFNEQRCGAEQ